MTRAVRPVGIVVLLALSVLAGAASWAQQPSSGTKTQGPPSLPTAPACNTEKFVQCQESADSDAEATTAALSTRSRAATRLAAVFDNDGDDDA
jgi:hypothetical protein